MAQIDLRNATLDIVTGDVINGTINNAAGYPAGATFIAVDGFSVAIPVGSTFLISSETGTPSHTVTATHGGSTPIGIDFSTAIASGGVADNASVTVTLPAGGQVSADATAGDLTISVSGFTSAIPVGATFTITGETGSPSHTVVSTVGGSNPSSITFTTAIASGGATTGDAITLSFAGAINNPLTPMTNGLTTIPVTGFSEAILEGMVFTITGSTDSYEVLSSVGGGSPSSITFSPALRTAAGLPANGAAITIHTDVTRVHIGEGNVTFEVKRNMEYIHDQRKVAFVRTGDDEPMDVSFDVIWEFLSSTSTDPLTVEEAVTNKYDTGTLLTSGADPCEPFAVDLRITYTPPCSGVEREIVTLPEFRFESIPHDLKAGTFSCKGKCKSIKPIYQRSA